MRNNVTLFSLLFFPLLVNAQSYNGEAEIAILSLLGIAAPIFFLIGLFLGVKYLKKATQQEDSPRLRLAGWAVGIVNGFLGLLWFWLAWMFLDSIQTDWWLLLLLGGFGLAAFVPLVLMVLGDKRA